MNIIDVYMSRNNLSLYNGDKNHQKEDLNRQLLISGKSKVIKRGGKYASQSAI